ncbi:protease, partial [Streptomyces sp. SID5643]|nr:protease [Streptomyces sp. SID5643]
MNEGKPTKAKWWSRPRPQDPAQEPEGGDGAAAEDPGAHGPVTATAEPTGTDGDFELARPAARPAEDGDYELRRPEAVPSAGSAGGSGEPVAAAPEQEETAPGAAAAVVPAAREPGGQDVPAASVAPAATVSSPGPAEGAPRPLHDPDPYSTPPYGEPGPWAPAPPVQHPAATPAQGVAVPGQQPTVPGASAAPSGHGTSNAPAAMPP